MKVWATLAGAVYVTALAPGCSSDDSREPAGQAGHAGQTSHTGGASEGGGASGYSGATAQTGGSRTTGGADAVAGGGGGGAAGSASGAGSPGAGDGGSAGEAPAGPPYRAVIGEFCPVDATLGVVELRTTPSPYVQVFLYDRIDPWIGEAELSTPTCEFHRYTPLGCTGCAQGEVCSVERECVPERRTIKTTRLQVSTESEQREYVADPDLGGIYSMLDIGGASSSYAMILSWDEMQVILDAMPVASGALGELAITTENDQYDMPGALDATWQPPGDAAFVSSRIPINHHAGGPTFTDCRAPSSAGAFHADADMIDPLAVQTGLEFQGVDHVFVAAARTPQGCVEFRFGTHISVFPL